MAVSGPDHNVPPPRGSGVVFVAGAGGFIGRHVASAFRRAGWRTVGFSRSEPTPDPLLDLLEPDQRFVGPIAQETLAAATHAGGMPELLVHAAGGATVGASFDDPPEDFARNVETTCEVLDFLRRDALNARLVFLSSAAVYGASDEEHITESALLAPLSPYGEHKAEAEKLIRAAVSERGLDAVIGRFFSVYGPGNRKQLLWDIARRILAGEARLMLSGTGLEARDFLYIDDAVRLIGFLCTPDRGAAPAVVNGGTGTATTVREAVEGIARALDADVEFMFSGEERTGDPKRLVASPEAARGLGFAPSVSFAEGVDCYARWVELTSPARQ